MATVTPPHPPDDRPPVLATAVTLTALAILVGVGVWREMHEASTPRPPTAPHTGTVALGGASEAVSTSQVLTVYLVDSVLAADTLRANLAEADAIRASLGLPPLVVDLRRAEPPRPVFYLAATDEQATYALRFSAELNALRSELGQPQVPVGALVVGADATPALDGLPAAPGTRFIDLRTTPTAVTASDEEVVYLVASPEQAAALQARLDAAAAGVARGGAPQPRATVLVEGTAEAASVLRVLRDLAPAGVRLADLRRA